MLRRHGPKMPGAIVCDQWREMPPRRSKKATWDDLIEVGNAGWRGSDAVAPSFLVRVRVGQSQRDAVEQHKNLRRQLIEPELRPVLARQDAS